MTKRLVDINDDILNEARRVSGATTMKDTVNIALSQLVETELRRRHLRRLESSAGTDLNDQNIMDGAWR